MLAKINKITSWQAALIIAVLGFVVYSTGLTNAFWNDDTTQIVNNIPVHSIAHIKLFFEGGTFYNGQGLERLNGVYYRPLMITAFSLLYTLFGPHAFYFHLLQLMLCIGSAIILYLFFRYSFKPALALFLSLIFLLHPIDSQNVFYIAQMADVLFFFFGILALWLLVRFKSIRSLVPVALCLFLSLLSKETAILFVVMALLYLFWWDRKRLYAFVGIMVLPVTLYTVLRVHAIGVFNNSKSAPIDSLNLTHRLLTAPSIVLFYITKFIFPWKLAASGYFWTYPAFTVRHFILPSLIDLAVLGLIVYGASVIRQRASKSMFYTYVFFATWTVLGLLLLIQIIPLDMTASETWFYFPMVGVLGMIGIVLTVFPSRVRPSTFALAMAILLVGILGFRTAVRGFAWRNPIALAHEDISVSPQDYTAYTSLAGYSLEQDKFNEAEAYATHSVSIYPSYSGYNDLGLALYDLGDYAGATQNYKLGLRLYNSVGLYENLGDLTLFYGNPNANKQFLLNTLEKFPEDSKLWTYLAVLEDRYGDNADAKIAISTAARYGPVSQGFYEAIMNNQPFTLNLEHNGQSVKIP